MWIFFDHDALVFYLPPSVVEQWNLWIIFE